MSTNLTSKWHGTLTATYGLDRTEDAAVRAAVRAFGQMCAERLRDLERPDEPFIVDGGEKG